MVCRSHLYGAVFDKPKQTVAVAAQGKPSKATAGAVTQQGSSKARVVRTETSAEMLNDLVARWRAFKADVQQVSVMLLALIVNNQHKPTYIIIPYWMHDGMLAAIM